MRLTACFSMYSLMSMRTMFFSSSNRNSASARGELRLADARRAEQQERAQGPRGLLQAGARAAHGLADRLDRVALADRRARAMRSSMWSELLALGLEQPRRRECPSSG